MLIASSPRLAGWCALSFGKHLEIAADQPLARRCLRPTREKRLAAERARYMKWAERRAPSAEGRCTSGLRAFGPWRLVLGPLSAERVVAVKLAASAQRFRPQAF
jgi:hypothetical protein